MNWRKIITDYVDILRPEDYNVDDIYGALASQLAGKVSGNEAKEFIAKTIGVSYKMTGGSKKLILFIFIIIAVVVIIAIVITVICVVRKNKEEKINSPV